MVTVRSVVCREVQRTPGQARTELALREALENSHPSASATSTRTFRGQPFQWRRVASIVEEYYKSTGGIGLKARSNPLMVMDRDKAIQKVC